LGAPVVSNPVVVTVAPAPDLELVRRVERILRRLEHYVRDRGLLTNWRKVAAVLEKCRELLEYVAPGSTPPPPP